MSISENTDRDLSRKNAVSTDLDVPKVLIVDDNELLCSSLENLAESLGMKATHETTLSHGLRLALSENFDVVFLDVNLPDGSGLDGIARIQNKHFPPEIIIITGFGDEHGAQTAIQSGVWDYIEKSASFQNIRLSLTRAVEYRQQKKAKISRVTLKRESIVGTSPRISGCLDRVAQAANSDSPVLVTGETGTGKELFARAIHENSRQAQGSFVVVDCAALPDHLVESVLFGHKKGAFTGADTDQEGLVRQAAGGTLFLDEVGEMPPRIQKKFLRVLQEKRFRPIGGKAEVESDFRLISATHRVLPDMVNQGNFRSDLFFRIQSIRINLPPLRERPEDIPALVMQYIGRTSRMKGKASHGLAPDFLETLLSYDWPGNVRELHNTLDRVFAEAFDEPVLFSMHLPVNIRAASVKKQWSELEKKAPGESSDSAASPSEPLMPMKAYLEKMKVRYLAELMNQTRRDIHSACRLSGLSRAHLYHLLNKYGFRSNPSV